MLVVFMTLFCLVMSGSVSAGDSCEWRRRGIPHEEDGLEDGGRSRKEPQRDCGANHHRLQGWPQGYETAQSTLFSTSSVQSVSSLKKIRVIFSQFVKKTNKQMYGKNFCHIKSEKFFHYFILVPFLLTKRDTLPSVDSTILLPCHPRIMKCFFVYCALFFSSWIVFVFQGSLPLERSHRNRQEGWWSPKIWWVRCSLTSSSLTRLETQTLLLWLNY